MTEQYQKMHHFVIKNLSPIEHSIGHKWKYDDLEWFWYGFRDEESCHKFLDYLEANGFEHRGICFKGYTIGVYYH